MATFLQQRMLNGFGSLLLCVALSFTLTFLLSQSVSAEVVGRVTGNPQWHFVDKYKNFEIELYDDVSGGCWVNTGGSKNAIELEIIRSGGSIIEDGALTPSINIKALGYPITGGCTVFASVDVRTIQSGRIYSDNGDISTLFSPNCGTRGFY